ncbi:50S ribosomal protein L5 [Candidatus Berkelbacteria bacterium CG_4_10_14_0_8_um_filter_42_34]|uniref:Large ribosomal subunit protein uL5 n=1 Tax=Candidatus Berkelbacteria bacterium CG_4_10_14_0_8_um_filter_42_34 TaxID=1974502 RepID=A0A2M7SWC8_9BACT|nr:MAG: 50S ribosomal protein L5 [Candidatus Berkelbacteria bacterium CG_4_10_14_0_8_um_filter_42_34]
MANLAETYKRKIRTKMKESFGYSNDLAIPRITKVTVNVGAGKALDSPDLLKTIEADLAKITGQKPRINKSKKSISGFKLRSGQSVGLSATLRGKRMYDFLEKLAGVVLPRIRDFRGLKEKSFDREGNYSIGISEHVIFPEIKFDSVKEIFGLQICITTNAKTPKEGKKLLELFGFPFAKSNISSIKSV